MAYVYNLAGKGILFRSKKDPSTRRYCTPQVMTAVSFALTKIVISGAAKMQTIAEIIIQKIKLSRKDSFVLLRIRSFLPAP